MNFRYLKIFALFAIANYSQAAPPLPDGYYLELFLGHKSGGSEYHDELAEALSDMVEGKPEKYYCLRGLNHMEKGSGEIAEYKRKYTKKEVLEKCKGSETIAVGPFNSAAAAKAQETTYWNAMLHTYIDGVIYCQSSECTKVGE